MDLSPEGWQDVAAMNAQAAARRPTVTAERKAEIVATLTAYDEAHPLPNEWQTVAYQLPECDEAATARLTDCESFVLTDGSSIRWDEETGWLAED
ncbi:MAG: hypothetical protein JWO67_1821 [Streptosporangiaceae bacterium]|nr:hypothetical protein [Streptosporangiaceae bacterium]